MPKRKAGMLQGGLRFNHPEYGECEVLAGGEWTFDADGRATKEPHVYFHSVAVNVPDGVRDNHLTWDETKGIAHDLSSKVRALIARPVPKLSSNHAGTPASRLAGFKKHPVFHDDELLPFLSDDPTGFAAVLRSASPDAYKLACAAAKRFNKDMKRDGGAAAAAVRVTIRSLVTAVAMLADCARSSLARSRPKAADENDAAGYARTLDVTLDENGARYLETLLSLCGFVEGEGNAWTPACAGATHRFVGAHAHPTGVNPLRRAWAFPAGEVRAWRGDGAPASSQLANAQDATDGAVYAAAELELGPTARDDTGMLPAWMLRDMIENEWIEKKDVRLRAHAHIINESVRVFVVNKTIAGAGGVPLTIGAVAHIEFAWNGWARCSSPGDILLPFFRHHVARAIERL